MSTFQKVQTLSLKTTRAKVTATGQTERQTNRKKDIENYNIDRGSVARVANSYHDKNSRHDKKLVFKFGKYIYHRYIYITRPPCEWNRQTEERERRGEERDREIDRQTYRQTYRQRQTKTDR